MRAFELLAPAIGVPDAALADEAVIDPGRYNMCGRIGMIRIRTTL